MLIKIFYFLLLLVFLFNFNAQNLDPRLRRALNQSGLTIDEAKKIAEKQGLLDGVYQIMFN